MNPFDDTPSYQDVPTTNPFDNDVVVTGIRPVSTTTTPVIGMDNNLFGITTTTTSNTANSYENDLEDEDEVEDTPVDTTTTTSTSISPEASWQYLGDLPYRRIPIYTNVRWETTTTSHHKGSMNTATTSQSISQPQPQPQYGLASFPSSRSLLLHPIQQPQKNINNNFSNPRLLLSKTTMTKCVGCPNGGPIAVITIPLTTGSSSSSSSSRSSRNQSSTTLNNHPTTNSTTTNNNNNNSTTNDSNTTNTNTNTTTTTTTTTTTMTVPIRILTVSGKLLSSIEFPPPSLSPIIAVGGGGGGEDSKTTSSSSLPQQRQRRYVPTDILTMGFTNRCILIIVMKDSYCYTYNLRSEPILPPFYILERTTTTNTTNDGIELQMAHVYESGVAVLGMNQDSALVELFDHYDTDFQYYATTIHPTARCIVPTKTVVSTTTTTSHMNSNSNSSRSNSTGGAVHQYDWMKHQSNEGLPSNFAIVTYLPTAMYTTTSHPSCRFCAIAVLPRTRTTSRHPEIYLSTSDHSVVIVNAMTLRSTDVNCRSRISSPIVDMSFAPNGRFLACFTESSMLTVISASFETKVLDFDTSEGSNAPPLELKWCGEDSVVLHWKNLGILMVGPYGDWLRFPYEGMDNVFLLPEIDCCRVITDTTVEILQRVPPTTAQLLRIGSIDTAAMLLDASDAYHSGSPTSDGTARAILESGTLEDAIDACTDAATKEFDISTQKRLLRAASYGLHFSYKSIDGKSLIGGGSAFSKNEADFGILPSKTAMKFVDSARALRILNALRHPDVGFVATAAQFDAMTPTGVIARLIAMKRPALASAICAYLRLPKSVQLYARACLAASFIEAAPIQLSDSEVAERAIRIINGKSSKNSLNNDISSPNMNRGGYATVAHIANKNGRPGVANLLLMLESSVADKVPALISTGSYADALAVATTARDADYIFSALLDYERACLLSAANTNDIAKAQATFLATVVSKFTTEAFHTLRRYLLSTGDTKSLLSLLLKAQRFTDAGIAVGAKALQTDDFREKQGMLSESSRIFGLGKETAFLKTTTDDYIELLKDQETLRAKYGSFDVAPVTSSVTTSIAAVLSYAAASQDQREKTQLLADAEKLARKARMTPKRLYHIRVKAYADGGHWSALSDLADSRQTPIGYKPFIRAAINGYRDINRDEYILSFIQKLGSNEEKFDMLCEALLWKQALKVADKDLKDPRRVKQVKERCGDRVLQVEADEILGRLST